MLKHIHTTLCIILFFILVVSGKAHANQYNFIRYNETNGLNSNWIETIKQDSLGFIWLGTHNGLVKFDGYTFEHYKNIEGDSSSIISNEIIDIAQDPNNNLIIATNQGVSKYNYHQGNFEEISFNESEKFPSHYINDVHISPDGMLYSVKSGLVWKYSETDSLFHRLAELEPYEDEFVERHSTGVFIDDDGAFWVYGSGISYCDPTASRKKAIITKAINEIHSKAGKIDFIARRNARSVYIGTYKGLFILDWSVKPNAQLTHLFDSYALFDIYIAASDIYLATRKGLLVYNTITGEETLLNHSGANLSSLSSNSLRSVFQDKHQNLWVGSMDKGLCFMGANTKKFNVIKFEKHSKPYLDNSIVLSLLVDDRDDLWIGFQNFVGKYNTENKKIHYYEFKNKPGSGFHVNPIDLEIDKNRLYAGGWGSGIMVFDMNTEKTDRITFHKDVDHNHNFVRNVFKDSRGNFWFTAADLGLQKLNLNDQSYSGYRKNYDKPDSSLINDAITRVYESSDGKLWLGTFGGLSVFDPINETFKNYTETDDSNSLVNSWVFSIFEASDGLIYIGTSMGLSILNTETGHFNNYTENDGLVQNFIYGILEDDEQNIWLGTKGGISRFNPTTKTFKNYTKEDGLHGNQVEYSAFAKASDGTLYFGGRNGITSFLPDQIKDNPVIPEVVITDLFINYKRITPDNNNSILKKDISLTRKIELTHKHTVLNFRFTGLSYASSAKNKYSYMLEGFETEFTEPGYKREATYTNLSPGTYRFIVKASNNDNIWNETGTFLEIVVLPPWWRTVWAYLAYLIIFSFITFSVYRILLTRQKLESQIEIARLKMAESEEISTMKARFFTNISHELRTPLTLVLSPLENIVNQGQSYDFTNNLELFRIMRNNAKRLLQLVNQLLDFRKLEMDKIHFNPYYGNIMSAISNSFKLYKYYANEQQLKYSLHTSPTELFVNFDKDILDKILHNLLSNAFKYTNEQGEIKLSAEQISTNNSATTQLQIKVTDTGIGIPKENIPYIFDRFYMVKQDISTTGTGIGLSLSKELIELHNGTITVKSEPNKGTEFTIVLHLDQIKNTEQAAEADTTPEQLTYTPRTSHTENDSNEGKKMLIVDDTEDIRKYLKHEFRNNYFVEEARDGAEGLKKVLKVLPDIIISDVMMPNVDGISFCKKIKSDPQTSHIPVILISAKHSEGIQLEGFDLGADEYIKKPFNIDILKARVKYHLGIREKLKQKYIQQNFISPEEIATNSREEEFLKELYQTVFDNINDPGFNTKILCKRMGMSKTVLYSKLKALTGNSLAEFIKSARMDKASKLLLDVEKSVSDVAYEVGFTSSQQFYNTFAKFHNMSPSEYRKANTK